MFAPVHAPDLLRGTKVVKALALQTELLRAFHFRWSRDQSVRCHLAHPESSGIGVQREENLRLLKIARGLAAQRYSICIYQKYRGDKKKGTHIAPPSLSSSKSQDLPKSSDSWAWKLSCLASATLEDVAARLIDPTADVVVSIVCVCILQ